MVSVNCYCYLMFSYNNCKKIEKRPPANQKYVNASPLKSILKSPIFLGKVDTKYLLIYFV